MKHLYKFFTFNESNDSKQNKYRYKDNLGHPGIEEFLLDPQNQVIANKLESHLGDDYVGDRKPLIINFTGEGELYKKLKPSSFIEIIQNSLLTWEIVNYEYNSNTINLEANPIKGIRKGQLMNDSESGQ